MLVKLNEGLDSMGDLRRYLVEHPALIPLLGFQTVRSRAFACGFDTQASLPTGRHLTRMLREIPNSVLQYLLAGSVRLIQAELRLRQLAMGECISPDTKHILAWVKENNPKAYVETWKIAMTSTNSLPAIRTASWAAKDSITGERSSSR
jgi:hypothetical protein